MPKRRGKFKLCERRSIAGEIQHKAKKVETCTPGIGTYNPDAWRFEKPTKIKGFYTKTSERTTEFDNYLAIHGPGPGPIPGKESTIIPNDKLTTSKSRSIIIESKLQRWSPGKSDDNSPSPAKYDVAKAIEDRIWPVTRHFVIGK